MPRPGLGSTAPSGGVQVSLDGDSTADPSVFHDLVARLLLEYEHVLAVNGGLRAQLARVRAAMPRETFKAAEESAELEDCAALQVSAWRSGVSLAGTPSKANQNLLGVAGKASESTVGNASKGIIEEDQEEGCTVGFQVKISGEEGEEEGCAYGQLQALRGRARHSHSNISLQAKDPQRRMSSSSVGSLSSKDTVTKLSSNGRVLRGGSLSMYRLLEDSDSSCAARSYKAFMQVLLFFSVCTPLLQMPEQPLFPAALGTAVETLFDTVFTLELLVRFAICPAPRVFFFQAFNLIDLVSPATLTFRLIVTGFGFSVGEAMDVPSIFLLCLTPIFRCLKMLRRWETMHLLTKAFVDVLEALPVLLFPLLVLTLTFAALIYIAEPRGNIPSLPTAVWLTIVTMTTVGYGDIVPDSTGGVLIVSILVVVSVMYMAMPVAIIGSSFTQVWQERETVLLKHRTRKRLSQWGYTASDVPRLFEAFQRNSMRGLNMFEFSRMIKAMKLGLTDERILQLFRTFDLNSNGSISEKEFVRALFPSSYVEVFGMVAEVSSLCTSVE